MVLDIIISAALIAFGVLSIVLSIEQGIKDNQLMAILLIGIGCVIAGSWILIDTLTLAVVLRKIFGIIMSGLGLFLLIGFPDILEYQRADLSRAGIFIGLFVLVIGIYFLLF
jgi:hypothetical protein